MGDCLASLLAAHRFAKATGRALAIDWRGSAYAPRENLFPLLFEAPRVWDGVKTEVVDARRGMAIDAPTWPPGWTGEALAHAHLAGERGGHAEAVAKIGSNIDVDAPIVVFDGCIAPLAPDLPVSRRLLEALEVRADARCAVEAFVREHFADRLVVGVHVRHGNGGDIGAHASYWKHPGNALIRIADTVNLAAADLEVATGEVPVVFLCTDSAEVERMLARMLPGVIARPKRFLPAGSGELHLGDHAPSGLFDAFVDMLLLGEVDRLVRYPPGSYFSFWGATMAGRRVREHGNHSGAASSNHSTGQHRG